ncbi:MAG: PD40 domain-containing protein, partial [Candidatus Aminicenantes bacterium]|nr:PD40 domain-containing protein [Candidatus Aminicenantes bacterium]
RLDQETGKIHGQPMKATQRFEGANRSPAWSPDGKYLAYISYRGHSRMRRTVLCILSIESGKEHEPPVKLKEYYSPHWSHDGRSILVGDGGRTIFCINAKTGEAAPIMQIKEKESIHSPLYSPDGKLLYYVHNVKTENTYICRIMARDLKTGKDKELYRAPADDHTIALSREGRWLALLNRAKKRILKVISTSGGEPHELYRFEQGKSWIISLAWTPDGRYVLFSKQRPEPDSKWELWRIHAEGGKPQKLGLAMLGFDSLSVHPDGQRIAFSSSGFKMKPHEIWVMENFLPEANTQKKSKVWQ